MLYLGKIPFDGMLEEDIKTFIRDARILPIPDGCPIDLYIVFIIFTQHDFPTVQI